MYINDNKTKLWYSGAHKIWLWIAVGKSNLLHFVSENMADYLVNYISENAGIEWIFVDILIDKSKKKRSFFIHRALFLCKCLW